MTQDMLVRPAELEDLPAVAEIFAWYVAHSVTTFETEARSVDEWRVRLAELSAQGWPFLVAELQDRVIGYAYVSPWRTRPAYRYTVEDSVYLAPEHTGRRRGQVLLTELLHAAAAAGAREVVAVVSGGHASLSVHQAVGFEPVGRLSRVGFKHGHWIDTVLLQASLSGTVNP